MQQAFDLALKAKGKVSPNPLVGCVIVDSLGQRIGAGYHKIYGGAHAEVEAVKSVENRCLRRCNGIRYFTALFSSW